MSIKTETKVEVLFDVNASEGLSEEEKTNHFNSRLSTKDQRRGEHSVMGLSKKSITIFQ
jgi:protein subunit release factor B